MSHIVTLQAKVHEPAAVAAACQRLNLASPQHGTAQLFSGQAQGLLVQLPGWQYPLVIDSLSGVIHYDNFEQRWGNNSTWITSYSCMRSSVPNWKRARRATASVSKLFRMAASS